MRVEDVDGVEGCGVWCIELGVVTDNHPMNTLTH
jgi:hypothetical protein